MRWSGSGGAPATLLIPKRRPLCLCIMHTAFSGVCAHICLSLLPPFVPLNERRRKRSASAPPVEVNASPVRRNHRPATRGHLPPAPVRVRLSVRALACHPSHSLSHYRPSTLSSSGSRGYFSRPLASSASSAPSSPSPSSPQEISGISRRTKKLPYHDVRCCTCQQPIPPTASLPLSLLSLPTHDPETRSRHPFRASRRLLQ